MKYENKPFTDAIGKEIVSRYKNNKFALCTLKTGTGKTFIAIHAAGLQHKNCHMVIIAPTAKTQDGSWGKSIDAYNETMNTSITYDSITFDKLKNDKYRAPIMNNMHNAEYVYLVFDEIHMIKKSTSKRGIAAIDLSRNANVNKILGLSATAIPNDPFDACTYLILNEKYKNQTHFRDMHAVRYDKYYKPIYKNESDIRNKDLYDQYIKEITVYVEADSLLPKVIESYHIIKLSNTGEYIEPLFNSEKHPFGDLERRTSFGHYKQALRYQKNGWYESVPEANNILLSILAKDPNRKMMLYKVLEYLFNKENAKPIIIGYRLNVEKEAIEDVCNKLQLNIQYINGKQKDMTKPKHNKTAILLQYQAGGAGIELAYAPTTIFYTPTYSNQDLEQTKGRNVRSGMKDIVNHHYITSDNKRDFLIWQAVYRKKVLSDEFLEMCNQEEFKKYLSIKD